MSEHERYRQEHIAAIRAKLKPCPFCGAADKHLEVPRPGAMYVTCTACDSFGPSVTHPIGTQYDVQIAIAIDQWNTRHEQP